MDVVEASLDDLDEIGCLTFKCFKAFKMEDRGYSLDLEDWKKKMSSWIQSPNFYVHIIEEFNNIIGYMVLAILPTLFSNKVSQLPELSIQPDPGLSNFKKAKIVKKFIEKIDIIKKNRKIDMSLIACYKEFNIEKFLISQGYEFSHKVFIKK